MSLNRMERFHLKFGGYVGEPLFCYKKICIDAGLASARALQHTEPYNKHLHDGVILLL